MAYTALIFAVLTTVAILVIFVALLKLFNRPDPIESRLDEYGVRDELSALAASAEGRGKTWLIRFWRRLSSGVGLGKRLAQLLIQADIPMTAAEYGLIIILSAAFGFIIGTLRAGAILGIILAAIFGSIPFIFLANRRSRRQFAFTAQLPDILTLLVGALRAGVGLSQALQIVADQTTPPASTELKRAWQSISLGISAQQALGEIVDRIGTDDIALVITAINVQYEMGGNLAQTLETAGETVRDRIRILREIRVLTTQQRITGYVLAFLPVALAIMLFIATPEHMSKLFAPGWIRLLPITAALLQIIGFVIISQILKIEV